MLDLALILADLDANVLGFEGRLSAYRRAHGPVPGRPTGAWVVQFDRTSSLHAGCVYDQVRALDWDSVFMLVASHYEFMHARLCNCYQEALDTVEFRRGVVHLSRRLPHTYSAQYSFGVVGDAVLGYALVLGSLAASVYFSLEALSGSWAAAAYWGGSGLGLLLSMLGVRTYLTAMEGVDLCNAQARERFVRLMVDNDVTTATYTPVLAQHPDVPRLCRVGRELSEVWRACNPGPRLSVLGWSTYDPHTAALVIHALLFGLLLFWLVAWELLRATLGRSPLGGRFLARPLAPAARRSAAHGPAPRRASAKDKDKENPTTADGGHPPKPPR